MLSDTVTRSKCLVPCPVCIITAGHEERVSNKANNTQGTGHYLEGKGGLNCLRKEWVGGGGSRNWSGEFEHRLPPSD